MKSMTKSAMAFCFAALLALGASACSDEGTTGPTGSEEANLSSNDGSSSPSSEGTSDAGSSKTVSSSSSFYYSFSGPTCCEGDVMYSFEFDLPAGRLFGEYLGAYGSQYADAASAEVVLLNEDGHYYPADRSLDVDACPTHDSRESGVSDCYRGWNDVDMFDEYGHVVAGVKLKRYVEGSTPGHVFGGLVYIATTHGVTVPTYFDQVTVDVKASEGAALTLVLLDAEAVSDSTRRQCEYERAAKFPFVGTGAWQKVTASLSAFQVDSTQNFDWRRIVGIAVAYERVATSEGEACASCGDEIMNLEWSRLQAN